MTCSIVTVGGSCVLFLKSTSFDLIIVSCPMIMSLLDSSAWRIRQDLFSSLNFFNCGDRS